MTTATRTKIADMLIELRGDRSATDVAREMQWITSQTLWFYEAGNYPVSLEVAFRFAKVYGVRPSVFDERLGDDPTIVPDELVGRRIAEARVAAGLRQHDLSGLIYNSGNSNTIRDWERGRSFPRLSQVYAIACVVECSPSTLDGRLARRATYQPRLPHVADEIYARGY